MNELTNNLSRKAQKAEKLGQKAAGLYWVSEPPVCIGHWRLTLFRNSLNDYRKGWLKMDGFHAVEPIAVDEDQAARMLGISRRLVFEFRTRGELRHVRFGRLVRYRVSDIQAFLERKLMGTDSTANGRQG